MLPDLMDRVRTSGTGRDVALDAESVLLYASVPEPLVHFVFHLVRSGARPVESDLVSELHPEGIAYVDGERDGLFAVLLKVAQIPARCAMTRGGVVLVHVTQIVVREIERVAPLPSCRKTAFTFVVEGFLPGAGEVPLGLPRLSVHA